MKINLCKIDTILFAVIIMEVKNNSAPVVLHEHSMARINENSMPVLDVDDFALDAFQLPNDEYPEQNEDNLNPEIIN